MSKHQHQPNGREKKVSLNKETKKVIYIGCEGKSTEPNYFKELYLELDRNKIKIIVEGFGSSNLSLIDDVIEAKKNNEADEFWIVYDKDDFPNQNFDNATKKARRKKINVAYSNDSFELWYLLHFQYVTSRLSRKDIGKKLSGLLDETYVKNNKKMNQLIHKRGGSQDIAIRNAKKLDDFHPVGTTPSNQNPSSLVYKLVERLNQFK